jgi:hypothetical protein
MDQEDYTNDLIAKNILTNQYKRNDIPISNRQGSGNEMKKAFETEINQLKGEIAVLRIQNDELTEKM